MRLRVMAYKSARNCDTLITLHPVWGNFFAGVPSCLTVSDWRRDRASNPPLPARGAETGTASGCQGRSREAGRDSASLYGLTQVRFAVVGSNPPEDSSDRIELAFRAPCDGIGDPAVDVRLMPAAPVDAYLDLRRERALGDLAVDGGPDNPVRERTVFKRMIRSGSGM